MFTGPAQVHPHGYGLKPRFPGDFLLRHLPEILHEHQILFPGRQGADGGFDALDPRLLQQPGVYPVRAGNFIEGCISRQLLPLSFVQVGNGSVSDSYDNIRAQFVAFKSPQQRYFFRQRQQAVAHRVFRRLTLL